MDNVNDNLKLEAAEVEQLRRLLEENDDIVITCHVTPDGDAVGSSLALWHLLTSMGKRATVVTPDDLPKNLSVLPGTASIVVNQRQEHKAADAFSRAGLVCCLDFNALMRVERVAPLVKAATCPKVLIDHHLGPEDFATLTISRPASSSTCYLLYSLIVAMGWADRISLPVAECVYAGMMTDTGNFSYNSNDYGLYLAVANLVARGVDKDRLYSQIVNSSSINRLRLNGYALAEKMKVYPAHRAALISLTRAELNRYHYERGDTESLVNRPLSAPDVVYSVFLREEEGYVKVSTRSKGDFPVNKLCENHFGGGGHKNAAGGEFRGTMTRAIELFESILDEYDRYLPSTSQEPDTENQPS